MKKVSSREAAAVSYGRGPFGRGDGGGDLGIEHVHLVSAEDPTKRKTLSVRALADPSRFEEF